MSALPSSVGARGGQYPFAVSIGANCAWTARTDVTWADVAPGSGQGTAAPRLSVNEHTRLDTRTLIVTINNQTFHVVQEGVSCVYTLSPQSLEVGDDGGRTSVVLTTLDGCGWNASSTDSWITVRTTSGTGTGTVFVDIARNTGDVRQGVLTVAGQRVTITQRRG